MQGQHSDIRQRGFERDWNRSQQRPTKVAIGGPDRQPNTPRQAAAAPEPKVNPHLDPRLQRPRVKEESAPAPTPPPARAAPATSAAAVPPPRQFGGSERKPTAAEIESARKRKLSNGQNGPDRKRPGTVEEEPQVKREKCDVDGKNTQHFCKNLIEKKFRKFSTVFFCMVHAWSRISHCFCCMSFYTGTNTVFCIYTVDYRWRVTSRLTTNQ